MNDIDVPFPDYGSLIHNATLALFRLLAETPTNPDPVLLHDCYEATAAMLMVVDRLLIRHGQLMKRQALDLGDDAGVQAQLQRTLAALHAARESVGNAGQCIARTTAVDWFAAGKG